MIRLLNQLEEKNSYSTSVGAMKIWLQHATVTRRSSTPSHYPKHPVEVPPLKVPNLKGWSLASYQGHRFEARRRSYFEVESCLKRLIDINPFDLFDLKC